MLIILAISGLVLFTGCTDVLIDAKITSDNLVKMTYTLSFSDTRDDKVMHDSLMEFLYDLTEYWQEIGYDASIRIEDRFVIAYCNMEKQCETREQAFEVLHEFMTNEITVFDKVEYTYNQDYYKEDYTISADIDMSNMIDENIYTEYPVIVGEDIDRVMDEANVVVRFTLPYDDTQEDNQINEKVFENTVMLNAPATVTAQGVIHNYYNIEKELYLFEAKEKKQHTLYILAAAAFVSIAGLITLLILGKRKKKKDDDESQGDMPE